MEYKNDGKEKEKETEAGKSIDSNSKNTKTNENSKSKKTLPEEIVDLNIPSGQILCNCFTCGHAVCAPMSVEDLTVGESSLDASAMTAYRQKVL